MRRWTISGWASDPTHLAAMTALAVLVVACYGGVLFGGRQFGFRDAAHFYYPLHWRIQQEWSAGRLPLWEPGANGGTPMLGSPMAAVLYPGKLVFAILPYAWGIRIYTVGHELMAFWAMVAMLRSWGVSRAGAALAGLSYAFGGPVLSDYFNVIYLVGAAWMPLGFRAADRWLRLGRRRGPVELALVLTMQVLGGDPEAAYLTLVCAGGYGVFLARSEAGARGRPWAWIAGLTALAVAWLWAGPRVARALHGEGGGGGQAMLAAAWAAGIAGYVVSRRRDHRARLTAMLLGLAASAALALLASAIQVLPAAETIAASARWSGAGPEFLYDSSLLPYRAVEAIWPNVFGTFTAGNRNWMPVLPPAGAYRPSPLSLYSGGLCVLLTAAAAGFRGGPPQRAWMTAVTLLGFWASVGAFAGISSWSTGSAEGTLGDDSFYGLLTTVLPGLRLFRLPFKLLVVTALGASALSGFGWDRIASGTGIRRASLLGGGLVALSFAGLVATATCRDRLTATLAARDPGHAIFGPLDAAGAVGWILSGFGQGALAMASGVAVLAWRARRPGSTGPAAAAILLLAADLAIADAPLIVAIPQADFEHESEIARAIRRSEQADPAPGPFRIHRLSSWVPAGWAEKPSGQRLRELVDWEIDTLQPGFAWLHGLGYVFVDESETAGFDQRRLFRPAMRPLDPGLASALGIDPGRRVLYHPRAAFDLWGARYFILPSYPGDWTLDNRSYAAFVDETDLIYPDLASRQGPAPAEDRRRWMLDRDVQVRRNRRAFPRAWVVRDARPIRPLDGGPPSAREALIGRLRASNAPGGTETSGPGDLRRTVYLETDDPATLAPYSHAELSGNSETSDDSVTVREEGPTRTVIDARLRSSGIVVLADRHAPGWELEIDGRPSPSYRANLLMRAAAVPAGSHTLVYAYRPSSVRLGGWISIAGLAAVVVWAIATAGAGSSSASRTNIDT